MNDYNKGMMSQYFNVYCYACNGFGNKANECRSRMGGSNLVEKGVTFHKCSKPRHVTKFCRSRNVKPSISQKKVDPAKKLDLVEMKKEVNKI